jgi:hypothetical protein
LPQGRATLLFTSAPHRPIVPRRARPLLMITGATESPAERVERVLKTIRARCMGYLSAEDLALVVRLPAIAAIERRSPGLKPPSPSPSRSAAGPASKGHAARCRSAPDRQDRFGQKAPMGFCARSGGRLSWLQKFGGRGERQKFWRSPHLVRDRFEANGLPRTIRNRAGPFRKFEFHGEV